jgi:hypothetical protein
MKPPLPVIAKVWRRLGFVALGIGLVMIALILYASLFTYR